MYEQFFNLRERPFSLSPDPDYLYPSRIHTEALSYLRYGFARAGFTVVTGEIGSGKTTLLQAALRGLGQRTCVSQIVNTILEPRELIEAVMLDFGLRPEPNQSKPRLLRDLSKFLAAQQRAGGDALLIIDEAQNLGATALEEVRMLSNLETARSKLLQIVLVGQPALRATLARTDLEQLRQRVSVSCHLSALDSEETAAYVNHRLRRASIGPALEFPRAVNHLVHRHSEGLPRRINIVADTILLFSYGSGDRVISLDVAHEAIDALEAAGVSAAQADAGAAVSSAANTSEGTTAAPDVGPPSIVSLEPPARPTVVAPGDMDGGSRPAPPADRANGSGDRDSPVTPRASGGSVPRVPPQTIPVRAGPTSAPIADRERTWGTRRRRSIGARAAALAGFGAVAIVAIAGVGPFREAPRLPPAFANAAVAASAPGSPVVSPRKIGSLPAPDASAPAADTLAPPQRRAADRPATQPSSLDVRTPPAVSRPPLIAMTRDESIERTSAPPDVASINATPAREETGPLSPTPAVAPPAAAAAVPTTAPLSTPETTLVTASAETAPAAAVTGAPRVSVNAGIPAASTVAIEERSVRAVLNEYRGAYNRLDVEAAKAVWPSVDAKTLGRAFERLESQAVNFSTCRISVSDQRGVASCVGSAQYVPKVGNRNPGTEPRQWTFDLQKANGEWTIVSVGTR